MKFLDLFAGVGGFRLGMEAAGHECVGFVEWDKYARKSYEAIHDTEGEWTRHDITEITNDEWKELRGTVDVICGGFPCQSFSVAGNRGGFEDTRGTMFFEIARAAEQIKPRFLLLENVKGLLSHDEGRTFGIILNTLDGLGYDIEWQVCNSKNYIPQNRERVFIIGHLRGSGGRKVFPIERVNGQINNSIIEVGNIRKNGTSQSGKVYDPEGLAPTLCRVHPVQILERPAQDQNNKIKLKGQIDIKGHESLKRVYDIDGVSPTLNAKSGGNTEPKIAIPVSEHDELTDQLIDGVKIKEATKKGYDIATEGDSINLAVPGSKTRRGRVGKGVANTLDTSCNQGVLVEQVKEIAQKTRKDLEIGVHIHENGDIRAHRMDDKKSGLSELNINYEENPSYTVTSAHPPKVYGDSTQYRIRRITPREAWRLQSFPDWAFERAREVNSDNQLYKQAGNAVTVLVVKAIAERLGIEE